MTSWPGTQSIGVVTLSLSPVCRESTTRSTSAELRPVEAGYERIRRIVFLGSMTKTDRMVKALGSVSKIAPWVSARAAYDALLVDVGGVLVVEHVVQVGHLALLVGDDGEADGVAGYVL